MCLGTWVRSVKAFAMNVVSLWFNKSVILNMLQPINNKSRHKVISLCGSAPPNLLDLNVVYKTEMLWNKNVS